MNFNKNLIIELLQNELVYERTEHKNTLSDLEMETQIRLTIEDNMNRIMCEKYQLQQLDIKQKKEINELNADFFDLGDLFMETIRKTKSDHKSESAITEIDEFLQKQYQSRIEYLEELIFDFGDDLEKKEKDSKAYWEITTNMEDIISDAAEDVSDLKKDIEDMQADWAQDAIEWDLIDKTQLNELVDHRHTIITQKDEIEMKDRESKETIYADKKCRYDLEQKIVTLQKENTELLKQLGAARAVNPVKPAKEEKIQKVTQKKEEAETATNGEEIKPEADPPGKDTKEMAMIACKNKLHAKNYDVTAEGKGLIANKQGTRKIEVQHAELPGSLKYIICGQTFYEFDQAVKASAYGIKATMQKNETEAVS